jgi:hypothetical protein
MSPGVGETLNLRHGAFTSRPEKTLLKSFLAFGKYPVPVMYTKRFTYMLFRVRSRTVSSVFTFYIKKYTRKPVRAMRPKARWLAQHGGPPGWLEENDPEGVNL